MSRDPLIAFAIGLAFVASATFVLAAAVHLDRRYGRRARGLERQMRRAGAQRAVPASLSPETLELRLPRLLRHLEDARWLRWLSGLLQRAGGRLSLPQWAGLSLALVLAALIVAVTLQVGWLAAGVCAVVAGAMPLAWLQLAAARRRARFEAQFPEALDFVARALRAGHGLVAGLGMVASELADPVATEFGIVCEESRFGMPLGEALARMAARVDSRDLDFFVVAVSIQRETGGNLAELLTGLAATVRERIKLAGKVRALSAEGRLSGLLMTGLPFVLGTILTAINPDYMALLWTTPEGRQTVAFTLVMMLVGSLWIQHLVRIRV